jgi:putative tryptophan/tyrosine transport system substrate-binding protein
MPRHSVLTFALCALLFAPCASAQAQQPEKIPRVGFLAQVSSSAISARLEAFRKGLNELGYVEGKNILIEFRYADGKLDRLTGLAAELARLKVEIIVTAGPTATHAVKETTSVIPVVMGFDNDPVGSGFVASLARPGGNITGLCSVAPETSGKRLELLKEVLPRLARVAMIGNSREPGNSPTLRETELAAKALRIQLEEFDVHDPQDIQPAFKEASKRRAEAVLVLQSPIANSKRAQFVELATKNRLIAIYPVPEFVEAGGLMSYAPRFTDLFRRAAYYVDKILKGMKPADLPVEQPTKFEFIVNLKATKQINLTVPPNVLVRADRVIK